MDQSEDHQAASQEAPTANQGVGLAVPGRRRLLRGGLLGAPALLALKSSPVLACNCKNPSGFTMSGNLSRNVSERNCQDPGKKPSQWQTNCTGTKYNGTSCDKSTRFKTYFTTNGTYADKSFDTALGSGDSNAQALIVAVFLEAAANGNGITFPNTTMVKDMWNKGVIAGSYQPVTSSPDTWNSSEVLYYLKYLTSQL